MRHIEVEAIPILHRYADEYRDIKRRINRDSTLALVLSLISNGLTYSFHQEPSLVAITAIGTSLLVELLRWRYLHVTDESLSKLMRHDVLASLPRIREDNCDDFGNQAHPLPPTPPTLPDSLSPSPVPATPPPGSLKAEAEVKVAIPV